MSKHQASPIRRRWSKYVTITLVILAVLVLTGVVVARKWYQDNLRPVATNQKSQTITIPVGYSLTEVANLLKEHKLIRSSSAFTQYVRSKQASDDIKAGTYQLSPSQSVSEIVSIITEGKVKTDLITILPGQRLDQIRKTFINSGFSATSVDQALDPAQYADHPALVDKPSGASLEGYLYPDSFQKTSDTTPETIIRQSLDLMQKHLTPSVRAAMVNQGLNVYQGIILASMVEQEANKQTDRNEVAQVFLSRIHDGMRLQSDVTAFYGAIVDNQPLSVNYDSLYNTYLHDGLPVGPVSNVTDSSLQAVAHPASTSYLYFVAGDDGTVYFSQTAADHEAQVQMYCHQSCATAGN